MTDYSNLCMGCMSEKGYNEVCPYCRWAQGSGPDSPDELDPGTVLNGRYIVGRKLGRGGFGVTYIGYDLTLRLKLAIKEYFPLYVGHRAMGQHLVSALGSAKQKDFRAGLEKFLEEARTLAQFAHHQNIVSVRDFFEANGTAYMVMVYIDGLTLEQYLDKQPGKRVSFDTAFRIMTPVMDALRTVHKAGVIHRDISPDNIFITSGQQVRLLDFGAAKHALSRASRNFSVVLKPGYAPFEQYYSTSEQGPWTDVYGVGATFYHLLAGQAPPESPARSDYDTMQRPSALGIQIEPQQEQALLNALAVHPQARLKSMDEFQAALQPQTAEGIQRLLLGASVNHTGPVLSPKKEIQAIPADMPVYKGTPERNQVDVKIVSPSGEKVHEASLATTVSVERIIEKIVQLKNWPVVSDGGIPISYKFFHDASGKQLTNGQTLADANVRDGDVLLMLVNDGSAKVELPKSDSLQNVPISKKIVIKKWWMVAAALAVAVGLSVYLNGHMTWTSNDGTYYGQARWGKRHGLGTLVSPDGSRYTSNWVDGFAEGPGELLLPDGRKYTGTYDLSKKIAVFQLSDGTRYEGGFERNNYNGVGKLKKTNGAEYEGDFKGGKKEGRGILRMPDGTKYDGEFRNDELHGKTKIFKKSGEFIEGKFVDGRQDGEFRRFPSNSSDEAGLMFVSKWRNGRQIEAEQTKAAISVKTIWVRNSADSRNANNPRFSKPSIRYIWFLAQVVSLSPHPLHGAVDVKYIGPNGNLIRSVNGPWNYTFAKPISSSGRIEGGLGQADYSSFNYGRHFIQIFWKGIQVGETYFDVD